MPKQGPAGIKVHLGRTVKIPVKLDTPLKEMILSLLRVRNVKQAEISLTFVGTKRIRKLNREYLGRDRATDVLSFDLSGEGLVSESIPNAGSLLVGDIYICVPRAIKQAADYGIPPEGELFRLAVHGVLHLLGYDHKNDTNSRRMNRLQEKLVNKYRSGHPL